MAFTLHVSSFGVLERQLDGLWTDFVVLLRTSLLCIDPVFLTLSFKSWNSLRWHFARGYRYVYWHCFTSHRGPLGCESNVYTASSLGVRREWFVSTTTRSFYSWERPGTHGAEGWVGVGACLDGHGKPLLLRGSIPGPPSSYRVAVHTMLCRPLSRNVGYNIKRNLEWSEHVCRTVKTKFGRIILTGWL